MFKALRYLILALAFASATHTSTMAPQGLRSYASSLIATLKKYIGFGRNHQAPAHHNGHHNQPAVGSSYFSRFLSFFNQFRRPAVVAQANRLVIPQAHHDIVALNQHEDLAKYRADLLDIDRRLRIAHQAAHAPIIPNVTTAINGLIKQKNELIDKIRLLEPRQ